MAAVSVKIFINVRCCQLVTSSKFNYMYIRINELHCLCVVTQELKFSFQTKERLIFVMEYVNGGEVSNKSVLS